jgi:peptidoglycan/LPS O-acetylase OafA/YrhL
MIVLEHSAGLLGKEFSKCIASYCLDQGVSFFFVLSGFILYYSYPKLTSRGQIAEFLTARIARIWPTHIATATLFALLFSVWWLPQGSRVPWVTLANVFLLQAWIPQSRAYFSFNAPSWSVSTELFFYLLFPLLVVNWEKTWRTKLLACGTLTAGMLLLCNYLKLHGTSSPISSLFHALLYINPISRLLEFVLGMTGGLLFVNLSRRRLSRAVASALEILFVVLALTNLYLSSILFSAMRNCAGSPLPYWLYYTSGAPVYACLITTLAFQKGWVSSFLSLRPLIILGEISYSVYLVHWIILQWFQEHTTFATITHLAVYFIYWSSVLAIATANYFFLEKPCRSFLKKVFFKTRSKMFTYSELKPPETFSIQNDEFPNKLF